MSCIYARIHVSPYNNDYMYMYISNKTSIYSTIIANNTGNCAAVTTLSSLSLSLSLSPPLPSSLTQCMDQ